MPTRIKPARRITARYRCNHCGQIVERVSCGPPKRWIVSVCGNSGDRTVRLWLIPGVLRQPLSSWNAGVRANKMFTRLGLVTVEDLIQKTPWELLAVPGFGCTNLMLVRERLSRLGLSLRQSDRK